MFSLIKHYSTFVVDCEHNTFESRKKVLLERMAMRESSEDRHYISPEVELYLSKNLNKLYSIFYGCNNNCGYVLSISLSPDLTEFVFVINKLSDNLIECNYIQPELSLLQYQQLSDWIYFNKDKIKPSDVELARQQWLNTIIEQ